MKKFVFITLAFFLSVSCFSHDAATNAKRLQKYGYMRWRLKNYFLVVGDCYGYSTPAGIKIIYLK